MVLRSSSREAHADARARLDELAGRPEATVDSLALLGQGLFAVVDLLDQEIALRRLLSDASRSAAARAGLLTSLLADRVGADALALTSAAVQARWSTPRDLVDTLEEVAVEAVAASAQAAGTLDDVEDELFRFGRVVAADPALRAALTDVALPQERKSGLVDALLAQRTAPVTVTLVRRAVTVAHGGGFEQELTRFAQIAALRRARLVAHVRVARPLDPAQRERLQAGLTRTYGREVHLNVEVDPSVLGGVEVRIGDEVIDGTVASRLDEARRRLAG
jgi:F-type H+-transporting ATPase subunit delta